MQIFLKYASILELQTSVTPSDYEKDSRAVIIPPAKHELFLGALAPTNNISPVPLGAMWYPNPFSVEQDSGIVFLYFHGGAFVIGTALPDVCGFPTSTLTAAFLGSKALAFSNRLASKDASCAFPAAVQDALSAYVYLLSERVPAHNIILAGDSAGCNLAIAMVRYLASSNGSLVGILEPKAAILSSPWVDVYAMRCFDPVSSSLYSRTATDYVPPGLLFWGARTYIPRKTNGEIDMYISPYSRPFLTSTKLWVLLGGEEVLAFEGGKWAKEMEDIGCKVVVEIVPLASHAILGVGGIMGWKEHAERAVHKAKEWLENQE